MADKVGAGVRNPALGTATVLESNDDETKVRFDKDDARRTLLNQYLEPSRHELKITVKLMAAIELTLDDLFQLGRLTLKRRAHCWASFSVNAVNDTWIFITRGRTIEEKRNYMQGKCRVIEAIAEIYLSERFEGGRVLPAIEGAKYRTNAPRSLRGQREDVPIAQSKLPRNWLTEGPVGFRSPRPAIYAPCEVQPLTASPLRCKPSIGLEPPAKLENWGQRKPSPLIRQKKFVYAVDSFPARRL